MLVIVNGKKLKIDRQQLIIALKQQLLGVILCFFMHLKSIWTHPQGSQGCQKIHKNMLQIKVLSFCARNTPKRHKLRKIVKIEKKCQKNPVFLDIFEYSSIWGQYLCTKSQMARLVDPDASLDTPGTPGGGSILKKSRF